MNPIEMHGRWNVLREMLKQKWSELTDDDLQYAEGKTEEMIGRIQKRTGQAREAVENFIREVGA